jgi:hypothetical protein
MSSQAIIALDSISYIYRLVHPILRSTHISSLSAPERQVITSTRQVLMIIIDTIFM